jgi:hypothetical protein
MADIVTPEYHLLGETTGGVSQDNRKWGHHTAHEPRFRSCIFIAIFILCL